MERVEYDTTPGLWETSTAAVPAAVAEEYYDKTVTRNWQLFSPLAIPDLPEKRTLPKWDSHMPWKRL